MAQVPGELLPWPPGVPSTGTGERPHTAGAPHSPWVGGGGCGSGGGCEDVTSSRARSICSETGVEAVLESDGLRVGMGVGAILRWLSRWLPVKQTPTLVSEGRDARWAQDCTPWGLASISSLESGWGLGAPQAPQGPDHNSRAYKPGPWGPAPLQGQGKEAGSTCSGDRHQRSAVRLGSEGRGAAGKRGPPSPPAEAATYMGGRKRGLGCGDR